MRVVCFGEAVVDLKEEQEDCWRAYLGGAPVNVAVALARLQVPVGFASQLSTDPHGEKFREHLMQAGVDLSLCLESSAPSTLALVQMQDGQPRFGFYNQGTADALYDARPKLPPSVKVISYGSVALANPVSRAAILTILRQQGRGRLKVLDPNVRPFLIENQADFISQFHEALSLASLVKLSEEDMALLGEGRPLEHTARDWLERHAHLCGLIITMGAKGARVLGPKVDVFQASPQVKVRDTIGAGDAFKAGLISRLLAREALDDLMLKQLSTENWTEILSFSVAAAALSCTRAGAHGPSLPEVEAFLNTWKDA